MVSVPSDSSSLDPVLWLSAAAGNLSVIPAGYDHLPTWMCWVRPAGGQSWER